MIHQVIFRISALFHGLGIINTVAFGDGFDLLGITTKPDDGGMEMFQIFFQIFRRVTLGIHGLKQWCDFLGIGARCFLLVNIVKVPFLTDLDIINARSLWIDACLLPGVFTGIFIGRKLIAKILQKMFEILLYVFSVIAGSRLLFF